MTPVQATRGCHSLIEGPKHESENNFEGPMETPDRVCQSCGVLGDCCGHPWMGELHQQRAACPEENSRFTVNLPDSRCGAEHAFLSPRRAGSDPVEGAV
jgi:hypothetical protein